MHNFLYIEPLQDSKSKDIVYNKPLSSTITITHSYPAFLRNSFVYTTSDLDKSVCMYPMNIASS